jgi:RimJ/RimL family protein N-acetyltransferase
VRQTAAVGALDVVTLDVVTLTGRHVTLEPMEHGHAGEIAAAAAGDRATYAYTRVPDGPESARRYVAWLLDDAAAGRVAPFVQRRRSDGVVVGCTRFMEPAWPLGRPHPDEVEIGGTWLAPAAQRTAVNTEAKLLLLGFAFDTWRVQRVAICTDARNEQSRRAIDRIGAGFEGVLRRHRLSNAPDEPGRLRDSALYAVTVDDWPQVRTRLHEALDEA